MDESGERIKLRVEAGKPVHLDAGRYELTVVMPEHMRRPQVAAYWCDEPVQITYRD